MPTWPDSLPKHFLEEGFRASGAGVLRTQTGQGPEMRRQRSTVGVRPLRGHMRMTNNQLEHFLFFFERELASGVYSFDMPDYRDNGETMRVSFTASPSWQGEAVDWIVTLPLQIEG